MSALVSVVAALAAVVSAVYLAYVLCRPERF